MKEAWDKTTASLEEFQAQLQEFISTAAVPASEWKRLNELNKKWKEVSKAINTFDTYVSPVESIAVKLPDAGKEFCELWQFWKDYLSEQHGVTMRSRAELKSLERLFELAENKPEEAAFYLNYAMSCRYKNFFKVDRENANKPKTGDKESDFN